MSFGATQCGLVRFGGVGRSNGRSVGPTDGRTNLALSQADGLDDDGVIPGDLAQQDNIVRVV